MASMAELWEECKKKNENNVKNQNKITKNHRTRWPLRNCFVERRDQDQVLVEIDR